MLLVDAVRAIETVGGILLWMSAIAFILLGVFVEVRRKSPHSTLLPKPRRSLPRKPRRVEPHSPGMVGAR
jgi:hypothetical protein